MTKLKAGDLLICKMGEESGSTMLLFYLEGSIAVFHETDTETGAIGIRAILFTQGSEYLEEWERYGWCLV